MKEIYKGLSIDGGGILGVGVTQFLMELENETGKPIIEQFDFITGTSTGSIIAGLLSVGLTAEDVHNIYKNQGSDIFYIPNLLWKFNPLKPRYSNEKLIKILENAAGNTKMSDVGIKMYIPTANIVMRSTHVFSNKHDERVVDAMLKSSAAPTFFAPQDQWVDGGIWMNNPALVGTLGFKRDMDIDLSQIKVLSLGTSGDYYHKDMSTKNTTIIHWLKYLIEFLLTGSEHGVEFFMDNLGVNDHIRLEPKLDKFLAIDDVGAMDSFTKIWSKIYNENKEKIKKFLE